jgi:hypothetical protein
VILPTCRSAYHRPGRQITAPVSISLIAGLQIGTIFGERTVIPCRGGSNDYFGKPSTNGRVQSALRSVPRPQRERHTGAASPL